MLAINIYRTTLESLAKQGNAEAALALKIGENYGEEGFKQVASKLCLDLETADSNLGEALASNDRSWNRQTDRYIEHARAAIRNALVRMAER